MRSGKPSRISLRKHWISSPLRAHFDLFAKYYIPWKVSRPAHAARLYGQKRGAADLNAQLRCVSLGKLSGCKKCQMISVQYA